MAGDSSAQVPFRELTERPHLPSLDGLRAVAVSGVMAFHFGALSFAFGRFGVTLFFVLSGFLITLLLLRERERAGTISLRKFYVRRALRIFPAYYVFLAVSFTTMVLIGTPPDTTLILASLFYLLNYAIALQVVPSSTVSHGWSLAVEEQFYAIWPALVVRFGRPPERLKRVVLGLLVAVAGWRTILAGIGVDGYAYYAFDTRFDALLIGCGLALCARDRWLQQVVRAVSLHPLLPVVPLALLPWSLTFSGFFNATLGYTAEALLLAVLLVQAMTLRDRAPWRFLNTRPARYLGALSYPMYLYHQPVAALVSHFGGWRSSVQFVANVALTVAAGAASYRLVERPFLRMKRRWEVVPTRD